jgi:hypothetical protein
MKSLNIGIFMIAVLSASTAFAEPFVMTIPGQSWQIGLHLPPLDEYQGKTQGNRFAFMGRTAQLGLVLSVIGEPWKEGGNAECRSAVWAKKSTQIPALDKTSVKIADQQKFSQVSYTVNPEIQGKKIKQSNMDFYFVFNGHCVDVHLSKIPQTKEDEQIFLQIGNSLAWGQTGR